MSEENWIKGELVNFSFEPQNVEASEISTFPRELTVRCEFELTEEGLDLFSEMTGDILDARVIE